MQAISFSTIPGWRKVATAAALALPGLCAAATGHGLDAYVVATFHYVDTNGQHHPNQVCASASGTCSAAMPYAVAQGTTVLGAADGSTSVVGNGRAGSGSGSVDLHWWDTFTIVSNSLPPGSPVTLEFQLDMAAAVVPSLAAPAPYTRAQAGLTYGGPDAPAVVFTSTQIGSTLHSTGQLVQVVGQVFSLWGNLRMFTDTGFNFPSDSGSAAASAVWHIDVLSGDAAYTTASGHSFVSAVPEAPSGALLASGLALVAWLLRARRLG